MTTVKLSTPRVLLVMGNPDDPNTWNEVTVQALNIDLLAYEREASLHKWPGPTRGGSFQWLTFLAWHALKRAGGEYAVDRFPDFAPLSVSAATTDDDDADVSPGTPTLPGVDTDSWSS